VSLDDFISETTRTTEYDPVSVTGELTDEELKVFEDELNDSGYNPEGTYRSRQHRERVAREFLDNPEVPPKFMEGRQHRTAEEARLDYAWWRVSGRDSVQKESIRAGALAIYDDNGQYGSQTERFRKALIRIEQRLKA
jgi:hypothetical protein